MVKYLSFGDTAILRVECCSGEVRCCSGTESLRVSYIITWRSDVATKRAVSRSAMEYARPGSCCDATAVSCLTSQHLRVVSQLPENKTCNDESYFMHETAIECCPTILEEWEKSCSSIEVSSPPLKALLSAGNEQHKAAARFDSTHRGMLR